jgi:Family of unknown function (DUF5677)
MKFSPKTGVDDVGFLSPDTAAISADLKSKHPLWFKLAEDINRTVTRLLTGYGLAGKGAVSVTVNVRDIVIVALLTRTLSNFQGSIILAEKGLAVEAKTLVRCCFENAFVIGTLAKEGNDFLKEMDWGDRFSLKARALWLLQDQNRLEHAPPGAVRGVEQRREQLKKETKSFEPPAWQNLAGRAGMADEFIHYAQLSAEAAHPSGEALDRYFVRGGRQYPVRGMNRGAYFAVDEIEDALKRGCHAMLLIGDAVATLFSDQEIAAELAEHTKAHTQMVAGKPAT